MQTAVPTVSNVPTVPDVIDYDEILSKLGRADRADVWARRYYRRKRYWPPLRTIVEGVRLEDVRLSGCPYAQVRPMSQETARAGLNLAKLWQEARGRGEQRGNG